MKIIAKTKDGVLIEATTHETKEILNSVTGIAPDELKVGQKIPAIDYAATIKKIKKLKDDYSFRQLVIQTSDFSRVIEELSLAVTKASNIEL